mgnify:CR=1 FL=1
MVRIVVTGIGLITPLGVTANESWSNVISSKSGVKKIPDSLFLTDDLRCKIAGIINLEGSSAFDIEKFIDAKEAKKMDKFIHYAIADFYPGRGLGHERIMDRIAIEGDQPH